MRTIYYKLGLFKSVLSEAATYSDIPCGDLDIDRMLSGRPAFRVESEGLIQKQKKIVLNFSKDISKLTPSDLFFLKFSSILASRQLIEDGFDVYLRRDGEFVRLNTLSISSILLIKLNDDDVYRDGHELHRELVRDLEVSYDDVTCVGLDDLSLIYEAHKDGEIELWLSDLLNLEFHTFIDDDSQALDKFSDELKSFSQIAFIINISSAAYGYEIKNIVNNLDQGIDEIINLIGDWLSHLVCEGQEFKRKLQLGFLSFPENLGVDPECLGSVCNIYITDKIEDIDKFERLFRSIRLIPEIVVSYIDNDILELSRAIDCQKVGKICLNNKKMVYGNFGDILGPVLMILSKYSNLIFEINNSSGDPWELDVTDKDNFFSFLDKGRIQLKGFITGLIFDQRTIITTRELKGLLGTCVEKIKLGLEEVSIIPLDMSFVLRCFSTGRSIMNLDEFLGKFGGKRFDWPVVLMSLSNMVVTTRQLELITSIFNHDIVLADFKLVLSSDQINEIDFRNMHLTGATVQNILKFIIQSAKRRLTKVYFRLDQLMALPSADFISPPDIYFNSIDKADYHKLISRKGYELFPFEDYAENELENNALQYKVDGAEFLVKKNSVYRVIERWLVDSGMPSLVSIASCKSDNYANPFPQGSSNERSLNGLLMSTQIQALKLKVECHSNMQGLFQSVDLQNLSELEVISPRGYGSFPDSNDFKSYRLFESLGDNKSSLKALKRMVLWDVCINDTVLLHVLKDASNLQQLDVRNIKIVFTNNQVFQEVVSYLNSFDISRDNYKHYFPSKESYQSNVDINWHSRRADLQFQKPEHGNDSVCDANTTSESNTYNVRRIFYSTTGAPHPSPAHYRLSVYDEVGVDSAHCHQNSAFVRKHSDDFKLRDCAPEIKFSSEHLYSLASSMSSGDDTDAFFAKTNLLISDQYQVVPALSVNDVITHMRLNPEIPVEVKYSETDGLYYIKRTDGERGLVGVEYIVTHNKDIVSSHDSEDLKSLVAYCAGFEAKSLDMSKHPNPTGKDFLKELVLQKVGACRHRSFAFKALLDNPDLREEIPGLSSLDLTGIRARIIDNGCHSYVEVDFNGVWQKYDLGGYPSEINILNEKEDPAQNPEAHAIQQTDESESVAAAAIAEEKPAAAVVRHYFSEPEKQGSPSAMCYVQNIVTKSESKRLIECEPEQLLGLCDRLQYFLLNTSRPYFYISSPDELILRRPYVEMQEGGAGIIQEGLTGPVYRFLLSEAEHRFLLINFENFSAHDLVRCNSLLDEEPSVDGVPLPAGTKVIGLIDSSYYKDASLYSRFGEAIEHCPVDSESLTPPAAFDVLDNINHDESVLTVDFFDNTNWRSRLLGFWQLGEAGLFYKPGEIMAAFKEGAMPAQILLKNAPLADPELNQFIIQANLRGYIEVEGKEYKWNRPVIYAQSNLSFPEGVLTDDKMSRGLPLGSAEVINPTTFIKLFKQYESQEIGSDEMRLIQTDGFLERHRNRELALYITEDLSHGQWSEMLSCAKEKQVKLSVFLAPQVGIPEDLDEILKLKINSSKYVLDKEAFIAGKAPRSDCCVGSSDIDLTVVSFTEDLSNVICIDVSELSSSDLLVSIKPQLSSGHSALSFTRKIGALHRALEKNSTVILHGHFSNEVRHHLQAFLYQRMNAEVKAGRVVIVASPGEANMFDMLVASYQHEVTVEEKGLLLRKYQDQIGLDSTQQIDLSKIDEDLPFVQQRALLRYQLIPGSKTGPWVGLTESLPKPDGQAVFELLDVKNKTEAVNASRLESVQAVFRHSPFVFLAGMSGVGKTSFVEKVWQNAAAGRHLFVGEDKLQDWAEDRSTGVKAIFLDEANITQNNWSQFEGLFSNNPPGMMIGNQYFQLTENHKVIFSGNPTTYSDDRTLPSLFRRHGNSVAFDPLPSEYIYHEMLLPLFSDDNDFSRKICLPILSLNQYLNSLSEQSVLLTPRELVMMVQLSLDFCQRNPGCVAVDVARYFAFELSRQFVPSDYLDEFDEKFKADRPVSEPVLFPKDATITLVSSNKSSAELLVDFLKLRQSHIQHSDKIASAGLGGVVLEGEPGLGKSELAIACLRAQGFTKRSLDASNTPEDQKYFYHLPTAANLKVKRDILIRAFHEGAVVICDEINAAASQEGLLNRLLMGKGPNGEDPKKPGFMLIGTQNPATMAGRAKTSAAMAHRMHYRVIPHYSEAEMRIILVEMGLPENCVDALVTQYLEASKTNAALCFRDVIVRAKEDLRGLSAESCSENLKVASPDVSENTLGGFFARRLNDDAADSPETSSDKREGSECSGPMLG